MTGTSEDRCFDKAVELLARRPHFRLELERKLQQRGFDSEEVESALQRLEARGYLDDRRLSQQWAEGELRRRGYGPARMRAELQRRGVVEEDVENALALVFPGGDLDLALEAARRWRRRGGGRPEALARHLSRRGFSQASILAALESGSDSPS